MHYVTVFALCIQSVGTYLIWPSRWNVSAHLALGFCVTAYIIPGLMTNVWDPFDDRTNALYTQINVVGAIATIAGLLLGSRVMIFKGLHRRFEQLYLSDSVQSASIRRMQNIAFLAVIGMIAAYCIMGFVPMFADDPFSAKQFKNQYTEPYHRADYLFRASFSVLRVAIPLLLTGWWVIRKPRLMVLALSAVILISISLARQSSAAGVLTFIGFLAARSRRGSLCFILLAAVIFPIGSASYYLLGLLTGIDSLTMRNSLDSVADLVASGSPDIFDVLTFLSGFQDTNNFTYGRTFFGGLIPGNYMWNPSVWSISYDDLGSDISTLVTGGLRFTVGIWGYCSFGWLGTFLVPFVSGFINGSFVRSMKTLPLDQSLLCSAIVLGIYMTWGRQLTEFYLWSIHAIPSIVFVLYVAFGLQRSHKGGPVVRNTAEPAS